MVRAAVTAVDTARLSAADRYAEVEGYVLLSGVEALVRVPLDQHRADARRGLRTATFISGYPGSPLGGVDLELARQRDLLRAHDVYFQPGLNEELAATAVFGSQLATALPGARYDGVLGLWYGKAPGLDRAADALKHANFAGVGRNGGVLAVAGDDPGAKSSTLPSAVETAFFDAAMPVLCPGHPQEVLDFGLHGFMLSRATGLVVGMKMATAVADGFATVAVGTDRINPVTPAVEHGGAPFRPRLEPNVLPPLTLELEETLFGPRLEGARLYARENRLNAITVRAPDAWLGIAAAGRTYYELRQALLDLGLNGAALRHHGIRLLRVGMVYPLERPTVEEFGRGLAEILVLEEKRPLLELFIKDICYGWAERPVVVGKVDDEGQPLVPQAGELDAGTIARVVGQRLQRRHPIESVAARLRQLAAPADGPAGGAALPVARTPYFCSGCPHNRSTVLPAGSIGGAGIGCHGMALYLNPNHVSVTQMGGEGAQWIGVAPFTDTPHFFQNLGDGTLFHSGSLAISAAVAAGINVTFKILYNSAVAMTGGQAAVGALPVPALVRRLAADGVRRVIVTTDDPGRYRRVRLPALAAVWHRDRLAEAQAALAATPGVTVLLHEQPCAAEQRRLRRRGRAPDPPARVFISPAVCEGCGDCGRKSNCLSVQPLETEFGRKTQIHQPSCNKDYSCLAGDCPAFLTVIPDPAAAAPGAGAAAAAPGAGAAAAAGHFPAPPADLPAPAAGSCRRPDTWAARLVGIGGTGVVTVNRVLAAAALLDGWQVQGLDQTGLSQKAGPVVSDLKLTADPREASNQLSRGEADLYLALDILVAAQAKHLAAADAARTVAVVSTSRVPTGQMVANPDLAFPALDGLRQALDRHSRRERNVYLDTVTVAEALFGDHMAANLIALGAAYQAGAVPVSALAIETAICTGGVAVAMNLAAFRWGRVAVHDPERLARACRGAAAPAGAGAGADVGPAAQRLIDAAGATGELRRLLTVRVPELVRYQNLAYAGRYVAFVRAVAEAEGRRVPGRTRIAEAVARYLFKLMAYKDEYEVARLHLRDLAAVRARFGPRARWYWHLHPPLLRRLGRKRKLRLGAWFAPLLRLLVALRWLRGTPLDIFGYDRVRRAERGLVAAYRQLVTAALARLTPDNYDAVVRLAELPERVRGYEAIKMASIREFRTVAAALLAALAGGERRRGA